jgi:hypothetical protein
MQNNLAYLKYIAQSASPIPFGTTPLTNVLKEPTNAADKALKSLLVGSGAARYSKSATTSFEDNWLQKYTGTPEEKAATGLLSKLKSTNSANAKNTTNMNAEINSAVAVGGDTDAIFKKYNIPTDKQVPLLTAAFKKVSSSKLSPLQQTYQGMSKAKQVEFYNSLTPAEQRILDNKD